MNNQTRDAAVAAWSQLRFDWSLTYEPKRVVSIVSPSRSGSTIMKHALCLHPELSSLAGEEEPYYKMVGRGYPWDPSDEFHSLDDKQQVLLRLMIGNELHNFEPVHNRHTLQASGVEEPPFVTDIKCRRTDTLVLKTPQNCYRRGVLEQLFPDAEVVYLVVERDPRAVLNGMLDAWLSGEFTARHTPGGWWCLDMPPNWSWDQPLFERCKNQLVSSLDFIARDYRDALAVFPFEEFEADWVGVCQAMWETLGLSAFEPDVAVLPHLSTTEAPEPERWRKKRPWLEVHMSGMM